MLTAVLCLIVVLIVLGLAAAFFRGLLVFMMVAPRGMIAAFMLIALAIALSGCAGVTVGELGYGPQQALHESSGAPRDWKGDGGRVDIRVRRISEDGGRYCEWSHESNLTSGFPFNNKYEDFEERVSCGVRVNLSAIADAVWEFSQ